MAEDDHQWPPMSPTATGMACRCPRCGQGQLFSGFLTLKDQCSRCGLDFSASDTGDGPAVFVIFLTGFLGVAVAFVLRFGFEAPMWLALFLTIGVTGAVTALVLRPMKATLYALQYRHRAEEGRLTE